MDLLSLNAVPLTDYDRMAARVRVLDLIDRRRQETGDPEIGTGIERLILAMSLTEIETATATDEKKARTSVTQE